MEQMLITDRRKNKKVTPQPGKTVLVPEPFFNLYYIKKARNTTVLQAFCSFSKYKNLIFKTALS